MYILHVTFWEIGFNKLQIKIKKSSFTNVLIISLVKHAPSYIQNITL